MRPSREWSVSEGLRGSLSSVLQHLGGRFFVTGGRELRSAAARSLMGVGWRERASELRLPALGTLAPLHAPLPVAPKQINQKRPNYSTSPFLPSFPAAGSSALFSRDTFCGCLSRAGSNVLGPTGQSRAEKPRGQKARRCTRPWTLDPQSPLRPSASLPGRTSPQRGPANSCDCNQLPQGRQLYPRLLPSSP